MPDERRIANQRQDQFARRIFVAGKSVRHAAGHRRHKLIFRRRSEATPDVNPPENLTASYKQGHPLSRGSTPAGKSCADLFSEWIDPELGKRLA